MLYTKGNCSPIAKVCKGLAKLVVVDIALTRDQDNPQLIPVPQLIESMDLRWRTGKRCAM